MGKFRDKLTQFMYGRYGMDQLSRLLLYGSFAILIIGLLLGSNLLYWLGIVLIIYTYYRMLSRNIYRREKENQAYLQFKCHFATGFHNWKSRQQDRRTHKIFKCPNCSQKIRVPRGKGKIAIKCPKCRIEFTRKS